MAKFEISSTLNEGYLFAIINCPSSRHTSREMQTLFRNLSGANAQDAYSIVEVTCPDTDSNRRYLKFYSNHRNATSPNWRVRLYQTEKAALVAQL